MTTNSIETRNLSSSAGRAAEIRVCQSVSRPKPSKATSITTASQKEHKCLQYYNMENGRDAALMIEHAATIDLGRIEQEAVIQRSSGDLQKDSAFANPRIETVNIHIGCLTETSSSQITG